MDVTCIQQFITPARTSALSSCNLALRIFIDFSSIEIKQSNIFTKEKDKDKESQELPTYTESFEGSFSNMVTLGTHVVAGVHNHPKEGPAIIQFQLEEAPKAPKLTRLSRTLMLVNVII